MALRAKCSPELIQRILDLHIETGSIRETGRRLDLHENTVRMYLKAARGLCDTCNTSVPHGQRYCAECNAKRSAWAKEARKQRRRDGICALCDNVITPPSQQYCDAHRRAHQRHAATYAEKITKERQIFCTGNPTPIQREKQIRYDYGAAGIVAWHRDKASCVLCDVRYEEKTIHIHHIDGDHTHNVESNLVCLCLRCHRLIHFLSQHPQPHRVLEWFVAHYPSHLVAQLIQRGQTKKSRGMVNPSTSTLAFDFGVS
jgi:hypothetical protein